MIGSVLSPVIMRFPFNASTTLLNSNLAVHYTNCAFKKHIALYLYDVIFLLVKQNFTCFIEASVMSLCSN